MRIWLRGALATLLLCSACTHLSACAKEEAAPAAPRKTTGERNCRDGATTIDLADELPPDARCEGGELAMHCVGNWAVLCDERNAVVDRTNCRERGRACVARTCDDAESCERCLACKPLHVRCGPDGARERCREDGSGYDPESACDEGAGEHCDVVSGECVDLCAQAREDRSYLGCEYYAVFSSNSSLDFDRVDERGLCQPFSFAIVVANAQGVPARVTVETPSGERIERTVNPGQARAIQLPCSLVLGAMRVFNPEMIDPEDLTAEDLLPPERFSTPPLSLAHHITSNVPVTVYQFNPLEFESEDSAGEPIYSYTNDASLLLPVSSLTGNYRVITVPTRQHELRSRYLDGPVQQTAPGFVTIVGVTDEPATVEIESSAHTLASEDGSLPALAPGERTTLTLQRGEVVQILSSTPRRCEGDDDDNEFGGTRTYCAVPRSYDLTGTRIAADQPVMVLSGHDCAFVPFNRWACDHLEEIMLPVEAWGREALVSVGAQVDCQPKLPNLVRVLAKDDGTRVRLEPELQEPVTLQAGEAFELEIDRDVRVIGSGPIAVAHYLLGQDYKGRGESGSFGKGDPSLSIAVPYEQWRDRYSILSPATFTNNFVNIIALRDQVVLVDGRLVTGFSPIEGTELVSAHIAVAGGQHTLESTSVFGITVYGYALYTSYMIPGGLDLTLINPPD